MCYLTIVNKTRRHCHSWLTGQQITCKNVSLAPSECTFILLFDVNVLLSITSISFQQQK